MTLGKLLKAARESAGLTQAMAAKLANVSVGTWSRCENGKRQPETNNIAAMAKAVRITPSQLATVAGCRAASERLSALLADQPPRLATSETSGIAIVVDAIQLLTAAGWDHKLVETRTNGEIRIVVEAILRDAAPV